MGRAPGRPLTCVGGRRLLALEAHRGAPPAPLPADPALLRGPVRGGGGGRCVTLAQTLGPGLAHAFSGLRRGRPSRAEFQSSGGPRRLDAGGGPRLPVMWVRVPTRG